MSVAERFDVAKYSTFVQWSDEDGEFIATCPEFEGLSGVGASPAEAIAVLREALEMAAEVFQEEGRELPQPRITEEFSGQFRLRVPKHLHAALASVAEREGVSLNTLAVAYLSAAIGQSVNLARPTVETKSKGETSVMNGTSEARTFIREGSMASGKGKNYHVVPAKSSPGKFVVKKEGSAAAITRPSTQAKAIDKAIPKAKQSHGEVVIHGRDGKIRDKDSYGKDPHPPRDKKH